MGNDPKCMEQFYHLIKLSGCFGAAGVLTTSILLLSMKKWAAVGYFPASTKTSQELFPRCAIKFLLSFSDHYERVLNQRL
jgi:hypothetical protein